MKGVEGMRYLKAITAISALMWFFGVLALPTEASQSKQPISDPQALAFAAKAITAMTSGATITDATLSGTVTWSAGSPQTGTAVAYAKGTGESRIDMTLSGGNRSDIRNNSSGTPAGAWVDANGTYNAYAAQNCWTDTSWFFAPLSAMSAAAIDPTLIVVYVGLETKNGSSVQHIQSYRYVVSTVPGVTALTQQLSTIDYYLDSSTFLPVAASFNTHPDSDATTNIPLEVDFLNYESINGVQVPSHIQEYWQGSVIFDFQMTSAVFNTGLSDSLFAIQ